MVAKTWYLTEVNANELCKNCARAQRRSPTNCQSWMGRVQMWLCVMAGETETCKEDGWRKRMRIRKTDKEDEAATVIWASRPVAVTHFHPHLVTSLSPHAITLSPYVRGTPSPLPLATGPVSWLSCGQVHLWPFVSLIHATEKRA